MLHFFICTYLIAGDYVLNNLLPASSNDTSKYPNGVVDTYKSGWDTNLLNCYTGSAWILREGSKSKEIADKWLKWADKYNTSTSNSIKAVSYMLDTDAWSTFANEAYADYAIGGPTIELFCTSYNETHDAKIICDDIFTTVDGYKLRKVNTAFNTSMSGLQTSGDFNDIYILNNENADGYWIASPSAQGNNYLMKASSNSYVSYDTYSTTSSYGFRPIVCLKSNISLINNGDGTYSVSSNIE